MQKRGTKLLTKHKLTQFPIDAGGVAFVPIENCAICKAKHLNARGIKTRIPRRAHHKACSKNLKTRGASEMTVFVNKEAARNLAANRAAIVHKAAEISQSQKYHGFFAQPTNQVATTMVPPSTPTTTATAALTTAGGLTNTTARFSTTTAMSTAKSIADPTSLRHELDERMTKLEREGDDYNWLVQKKYPAAIGLMVDYICSLFEHRKPSSTAMPQPKTVATQEAIQKYHAFFSEGSLSFTFGKEAKKKNRPPSPHYHALEGQSILHVDWKLAFPEVDLVCYTCRHFGETTQHLVHDRTNFSKRKNVFPIWTHSGLPMWCVVMNYKCEACKTCYAANDGRLLSVLPPDIAEAYPVLPMYASGHFHLQTDLSDDVELLMKTYANGKFVSSKLHRKLGLIYTRKARTYYLQSPTSGFVSYEAFTGGVTPPPGASIRASFDDAENSTLTPYAFSNFDRYEREMQSIDVSPNDKVAFDWTFQTIKNYNLPGAKAVFTGNKGSTNEIITLAIVPTTAVSQISHILLQSREKRNEFQPAVLYTDTCPHNEAFWKGIFGTYLETKLGLFHLIHRVMDTLDSKSNLYWKCVTKLRNAIYTYFATDEAGLLKALKDGSFSKTGLKLSDSEIRDLRHSKRWKQRYSEFLRKLILPGATHRYRLNLWMEEFKDSKDISGKPVFTRNTEKVTTEQLKKVHHASDVPGMDMYQKIPPGPRSTHGLPKWKCDRPESPLEKFHELLAHFGNSGMNRKLADTLTLGGTTEYNVKMRWKAKINKRRLAGEIVDIPGDFVDLPRFFDHSLLHYLNGLAQNCGLPAIFNDIHPVRENNGEVYLSKYFEAQMVRNQNFGQDQKTSMCLCPTCTKYITQTQEQARLLGPDNNDANDNSNNQTLLNYVPVFVPATPPLVVQPPSTQPPSTSTPSPAIFMPPIPLAALAYGGWVPRPQDYCYGNYHCATYATYLRQKNSGLQVLGKPPHCLTCPVRRNNAQR